MPPVPSPAKTNWSEYVRFSTSENTVQTLPDPDEVTFTIPANSAESKIIYVYALRGDSHTIGTGRQVKFTPYISDAEKTAFTDRVERLNGDWTAAAEAGVDPASDEAQALARRHVDWLQTVPANPAHEPGPLRGYLLGLGEMYVGDPRFALNYGGVEGATFVRDALRVYVERNL